MYVKSPFKSTYFKTKWFVIIICRQVPVLLIFTLGQFSQKLLVTLNVEMNKKVCGAAEEPEEMQKELGCKVLLKEVLRP